MRNEWSLIFFTLLVQMSIGTFILFAINIFSGIYTAEEIKINYIITTLVLLSCGMISSFLHLGNPRNAIHALKNSKSSWLSKEIFFIFLFIGVIIFKLLFYLFEIKNLEIENWASVFGIVIGLSTIYSMSQLYNLKTVPAWNSITTFIQFFSSTFTMGIVFILFFILFDNDARNEQLGYNSTIYISLLVLISISFISHLIKVKSLKNGSKPEIESYNKIVSEGYTINIIVTVAAIVAIFYHLLAVDYNNEFHLMLICILIIISEFSRRYLFFGSYNRIGI